jgi:hypothetical protein
MNLDINVVARSALVLCDEAISARQETASRYAFAVTYLLNFGKDFSGERYCARGLKTYDEK